MEKKLPVYQIEIDENDETTGVEIMNDNKMEYQFREIVKRTMSETECAELWYAKALAQGEKTRALS